MTSITTTYSKFFAWPPNEIQFKPREPILEAFLDINNARNNNLYIDKKLTLPRCEKNHAFFKRNDEKYSEYLKKNKVKPNLECDENYLKDKLQNKTEYQHTFSKCDKKNKNTTEEDHAVYDYLEECKANDTTTQSFFRNPSKYPINVYEMNKHILSAGFKPSLHLNVNNGLSFGGTSYKEGMCRDVELFFRLENRKSRNGPIDKYTKLANSKIQ